MQVLRTPRQVIAIGEDFDAGLSVARAPVMGTGTDLEPDLEPVPGIHNYCDRWCGRCRFAGSCAVHAPIREREASTPRVDSRVEPWRQWIDAAAARLPDVSPDLRAVAGPDDAGALMRDARLYTRLVCGWEQAASRRDRGAHPGAAADLSEAELPAHEVAAAHVICHEAPLIAIKLARALYLLADGSPGLGAIQTDRNGSAKVALLAMDRSSVAWRLLGRRAIADHPDNPATRLEALRSSTARLFPNARRFVRPGFDAPLPSEG